MAHHNFCMHNCIIQLHQCINLAAGLLFTQEEIIGSRLVSINWSLLVITGIFCVKRRGNMDAWPLMCQMWAKHILRELDIDRCGKLFTILMKYIKPKVAVQSLGNMRQIFPAYIHTNKTSLHLKKKKSSPEMYFKFEVDNFSIEKAMFQYIFTACSLSVRNCVSTPPHPSLF